MYESKNNDENQSSEEDYNKDQTMNDKTKYVYLGDMTDDDMPFNVGSEIS